MSALDWVIVAFTVLLAFYGYLQGFIVGALSLAGFAVGAFLGTRLAPLLLSQGDSLAVRAAVRAARRAAGRRRVRQRPGGAGRAGALGAADPGTADRRRPARRRADRVRRLGDRLDHRRRRAGRVGSRPLRTDIQDSTILRALDQLLPPSGPILNALARFDPLPSVRGPAADVAGPQRRASWPAPASRAARHSVVRVFGTRVRAGRGGQRLGGGARPGGHQRPRRRRRERHPGPDRRRRPPAMPAAGDRRSIPTTTSPSCGCPGWRCAHSWTDANAPSGTSAAILGYPLDGAFDAEPGRLGQTETVDTQNAYGQGHVLRTITALRGTGPARQLRRADGRRRAARWWRRCSRRSPALRAGRLRGPQRHRARRAAPRAGGRRGGVDRALRQLTVV